MLGLEIKTVDALATELFNSAYLRKYKQLPANLSRELVN